MSYYCGTCGSKLVSQKVKTGDEALRTGTTKTIHYKVLVVKTVSRYKCPNGCELHTVNQSKPITK